MTRHPGMWVRRIPRAVRPVVFGRVQRWEVVNGDGHPLRSFPSRRRARRWIKDHR